uniref:Uncharacterized protein n=1 Tax=Hyaloperonospora arabidopsidis (strain Emoy2) TaxID=559515 RepID=M4BEJ9_HYAAE
MSGWRRSSDSYSSRLGRRRRGRRGTVGGAGGFWVGAIGFTGRGHPKPLAWGLGGTFSTGVLIDGWVGDGCFVELGEGSGWDELRRRGGQEELTFVCVLVAVGHGGFFGLDWVDEDGSYACSIDDPLLKRH